jgi:hypothetical protein
MPAASVTLADLETKIRKITGRPTIERISQASLEDYINLYLEYDFPNELKTLDYHSTYSFYTVKDQDRYPLSAADRNNFKSFSKPVYCSGYLIDYYQNREQFYRFYPDQTTLFNYSTGTGIAGPYAGTLTTLPILKGSLVISADGVGASIIAQDNGNGGFVDGATGAVLVGAVNYLTGVTTVTFGAPVNIGTPIIARYAQYNAATPQGILFYHNEFILRPVPDSQYTIQLEAYLKPTALLNAPDTPYLNEYFQLIAYGASLKILSDSMETENYAKIKPMYDEQLRLIERRTIMQVKTQRTQTIYSEDSYGPSRMPPF